MTSIRIAPAEWLARLPAPDGKRSVLALERGALEVKLYAPRGTDPQQPHERDEIYVVVAGRGTFVHGERREPFGAGDFLFASAGLPHRFEDFTDDLAVWVVFYGPRGGEAPRSSSIRLAPGEWLARLGETPRFIEAWEHASLSVELYAPRGIDPQQPHARDEAYVVVSGSGMFVHGEQRDAFAAGDFLFVPAGMVHRFEEFTHDLVVWVLFFA